VRRLVFGLFLAVAPLLAQSGEVILAKHLVAEGGLQTSKTIQTLRMRGTVELAPGSVFPLVIELARPNKLRMESRAPDGLVYLRLFDGTKGYLTDAMGRLYEMTPRDGEAEASEGFGGYLLDPSIKGARADFLEHQQAQGRDCYRVKLTRPGGAISTHWIDTRTFLELQREEDRDTPKGRRTFVTRYSDFRMVQDLPIPFRREEGERFSPLSLVFQISTVEVNPKLADTDFTLSTKP